MEGVDHVDIIKVCCGSLVGQVNWMMKGKIPNWEGFIFRVARLDTIDLVVVHIGHTGCQFSRTRSRSGYDNQVSTGFDVVIFPHAFWRNDMIHIRRISFDWIVKIRINSVFLKLVAEGICSWLASVLCDDNRANKNSQFIEFVNQTKNFLVIRNAQVTTCFGMLDIASINSNHNLNLLFQFL